jgi:hypothetical protein
MEQHRAERAVIMVKNEKEGRAGRERKKLEKKTYSIHWVDTIAVTSNSQKSST